jgi:hypothetical protein
MMIKVTNELFNSAVTVSQEVVTQELRFVRKQV